MPSRRLDDRIRELSSQVRTTPEDKLEPLLKDLQSAIHEKIEFLRKAAARYLIRVKNHGHAHHPKERRSRDLYQ